MSKKMESNIKYQLKMDTVEVSKVEHIHDGITLNRPSSEPQVIETFDDKGEALYALSERFSYITQGSRNLLVFHEYYVEEVEYSTDGYSSTGAIISISSWK